MAAALRPGASRPSGSPRRGRAHRRRTIARVPRKALRVNWSSRRICASAERGSSPQASSSPRSARSTSAPKRSRMAASKAASLLNQALRVLPNSLLPGAPNQKSSTASASLAVRVAHRGSADKPARVDFDRAVAVGDPDDAVLPVDLQLHVALREQGELPALLGRHQPRVDVAGAFDPRRQAGPPGRRAMAERVDADPIGATARLDEASLLGLADLDPVDEPPGQVLLPQLGFLGLPHALGEVERAGVVVGGHVEREGEEADHHPLVGLGRVARERDEVVAVDGAIDVGQLHGGLANGRFLGHLPTVPQHATITAGNARRQSHEHEEVRSRQAARQEGRRADEGGRRLGPLRPGLGRRRRPARAASPRCRRRPGAVRLQAAGRPRRARCASRAPAATTASTGSSPSCCERRSSDRRRERMSGPAFDLFIIGAGSGGVRAARMAAQRGARVAVAEDAALGGTCVNLGCIPKKLYSFAAHYAESFEEAHGFGWSVAAPSFDWETLKANRRVEISRLNGVYGQLMTGAGVVLMRGRARVVGPNEVEVDGVRHRAERIVVATGGWPVPADVPGGERAISSNEIFDLRALPGAPGGHRRRLHRERVRFDLQRPGRARDPALSRRADPARLRSRHPPPRRRRDDQEGRRHPRRHQGARARGRHRRRDADRSRRRQHLRGRRGALRHRPRPQHARARPRGGRRQARRQRRGSSSTTAIAPTCRASMPSAT